ncbi:SLOG family protein [Streptomyces sp. NPDC058471]|uniref:SLOG family protein n=1 Tax=Streptomyces sp. NPDC058471 TaxID=3346516 RepID=UPI003664B0AD
MTPPYRVLVTGSRDWSDVRAVTAALDEAYEAAPNDRMFVVVHGDCPTGADAMARGWAASAWASSGEWGVDQDPFPAAWRLHGKQAGPIRNARMVAAGADLCLAFVRNGSRGASHTALLAEAAGIPTRRWTA